MRDSSKGERMPRSSFLLIVLLTCSTAGAQEPPARPNAPHPLPPGIYEIRPTHSNLCLTYSPAAGLRVPWLRQMPCVGGPPSLFLSEQRVHVVPAVAGGYFIQVNTNSQCATVARGVAFGPASIDVLDCNTRPGEVCSANADQIFNLRFIQPGPGTGANRIGDVYEVRTANNECWDIQGGRSDQGVDVVRFSCNGQSNQRLRFKFIAPFDGGPSLACARRVGW